MDTRIIKIQNVNTGDEQLREAGQIIKAGGLVAFPTETVYGLGGDALNRESARRIYAAKGRPSDNPLIVHICRMADMYNIASGVGTAAEAVAAAFWPGPLTLILPKQDVVPDETTGGLDTVAVRMPSHPAALKLIQYSGGFIAAPSANTSGRPSPTLAAHVAADMNGRIEMIIDGGEVGIGIESTIVDFTGTVPRILRPGSVTAGMLEAVIGKVEIDSGRMAESDSRAPRAPGMKYRHYAPGGELTVVAGRTSQTVAYINARLAEAHAAGKRTGVIAACENRHRYQADVVKSIGSRRDEVGMARQLYRILREFDETETEIIYSEAFSEEGIGQAVMNRLFKAAGYRIVELTEEDREDMKNGSIRE